MFNYQKKCIEERCKKIKNDWKIFNNFVKKNNLWKEARNSFPKLDAYLQRNSQFSIAFPSIDKKKNKNIGYSVAGGNFGKTTYPQFFESSIWSHVGS